MKAKILETAPALGIVSAPGDALERMIAAKLRREQGIHEHGSSAGALVGVASVDQGLRAPAAAHPR